MSFGKNLQYLRQLSAGMTQETLAEKLNVSRQTISKWEMDAANPEMDKALEICKIFNCTLDNLFREEIDKRSDAYSDLRTEEVKGFRYVEYTVISREPEADAIGRMCKCAEENGIANPKVIGWDFPKVSQEQVNVFNMHGYTAALILPEEGMKSKNRLRINMPRSILTGPSTIHFPQFPEPITPWGIICGRTGWPLWKMK